MGVVRSAEFEEIERKVERTNGFNVSSARMTPHRFGASEKKLFAVDTSL